MKTQIMITTNPNLPITMSFKDLERVYIYNSFEKGREEGGVFADYFLLRNS